MSKKMSTRKVTKRAKPAKRIKPKRSNVLKAKSIRNRKNVA